MTSKQATIIYNPASGRPGRRAENVGAMLRLLEARGVRAEARATRGPNDATALAREAIHSGAEVVISYGGDGTLNEVLQAAVAGRAALAVWPGGTANVVARELGMPAGLERLADAIAAGRTRRVAVGKASRPAGGHESEARYFLMFAGIGLDASIARRVNHRLKRRTGEFAYWVEGMRHLAAWRPEPFTLEVDGKSYEGVFALIGKGKGYGGGLLLTPNARMEEASFEVFIAPRRPLNLLYVADLAACYRGRPERSGAVIVRGSRVFANSNHAPWVEADGEIIGQLPMRFEAVPDALSLVVP